MTWTLDASTPTLDAGTGTATLDGSGGAGGASSIFNWAFAYGSDQHVSFKWWQSQLGDGYIQRVGNGINNIEDTWNINLLAKSPEEAQAIVSFLRARSNGQSFKWRPNYLNPLGDTIKVICNGYKVNPTTYNRFDISAVFRRVYGE